MSRRRRSTFVRESVIAASVERVFAFHELPDALRRLTPPWESSRVIQLAKISEVGSEAVIETRLLGLIPVRWVARHTVYDPPRMFEDVQVKGPFHFWRHRHLIEPHADGTLLRDEIEYEPPFHIFGQLAAPFLIIPRLDKLFDYRHAATREWCESKTLKNAEDKRAD